MISSISSRCVRVTRQGMTGLRRLSTAEPPPLPPPPPAKKAGPGRYIVLGALVAGGVYYKDTLYDLYKNDYDIYKKNDHVEALAAAAMEARKEHAEKEAAVAAAQEQKKEVEPEAPKAAPKAAPAKASSLVAPSSTEPVDWAKLREAIVDLLDEEDYDDGSFGPVFVRLAWHSAGTYDKNTKAGGTEGAGMRFSSEKDWGANAGLDIARARLEPIKAQFPGVSYSDLWSFAGTVAIEEMGGPEFKWRSGRKDLDGPSSLPDGLLPDADGRDKPDKPADHLRDIFGRMGFNDKEIVCLSGAHALGRCHTDRSSFWGPWTRAPTTFSNEYFRLLVEERWSKKKTHQGKEWNGPEQYEDPSGDLMMLPTDMSLVWDDKMLPYVQEYAQDEEAFFKDFAKVWIKLQELGVRKFHGTRRYYIFGPRE